ncbi:MAG: glycosyl transferase [Deltaproteobacteria bacterium]|nr:MAG: glycosyl transferase [Deltaproteobacteria bacterium]
MKIFIYCQHIWGVGHLFRSIEICKALQGHQVILVTGGPQVDASLPQHVREFRLPGLMTDRNYNGLFPTDRRKTLDQVKKERQKLLFDLFEKEAPDTFLIELYPFGRRAFRFELEPILKGVRNGSLPACRVVCSLRDILVEKKDPVSYEKRVADTLNRYFDALLIHADPNLVKLDETFSRIVDVVTPIFYTGFVTPKPAPGARHRFRQQLGISEDEFLIVASAGGGKAGIVLLQPLIGALAHLNSQDSVHLHIFTGPFMPDEEFERLRRNADKNVHVCRFTPDFLSFLTAADLSVSMGGYNTSMNILAAEVPALIWPYPGDREQGLRTERMAGIGAASVIRRKDLQPKRLGALMTRVLARKPQHTIRIDLNGALNTARWLEQGVNQ